MIALPFGKRSCPHLSRPFKVPVVALAAFLTLPPWKSKDDASLAGSNHGNAPSFDVSRDAPLRREGEQQSLFPSLHHQCHEFAALFSAGLFIKVTQTVGFAFPPNFWNLGRGRSG